MENAFVTFLTAYSALIQALATVVLVVLTIYYVRQVRRSAEELERTRKSDFMPMLAVRLESRGVRTVDVYLSNIGRGLAQRPVVKVPFEQPREIEETIMPGQENVLVTFENIGVPEILEIPEEERLLRVEYKDIFGRTLASEARLVSDEAEDGEVTKETIALADWQIVLPTRA